MELGAFNESLCVNHGEECLAQGKGCVAACCDHPRLPGSCPLFSSSHLTLSTGWFKSVGLGVLARGAVCAAVRGVRPWWKCLASTSARLLIS